MRRLLVQRRDLDPGDRDYRRIIGKALSLDGEDDPVLVLRSKRLESSIEKYTGSAWIKLKRKGNPHGVCCADDHVVLTFSSQ